jgi:catechol 2,3-dioxygenase-like lactoylglutathione lyase family enzyme
MLHDRLVSYAALVPQGTNPRSHDSRIGGPQGLEKLVGGTPVTESLACVTLLVHGYAEAIEFFTNALGFSLLEDTPLGDGKRWVVVAPSGSSGGRLLLAEASTPGQTQAVGNQAGGRVGFFLHTDDFAAKHRQMREKGVLFLEEPRHEVYGTVAVFEDLYGNRWDLLELRR